jgi:hypothetical protein
MPIRVGAVGAPNLDVGESLAAWLRWMAVLHAASWQRPVHGYLGGRSKGRPSRNGGKPVAIASCLPIYAPRLLFPRLAVVTR